MRIVIHYYGKVRDPNLQAVCTEYVKRCQRFARVEMRELKASQDSWNQPGAARVLLSPEGDPLDTNEFHQLVDECRQAARNLHLVIGPTDGLPEAWKAKADRLISLSRMTLPHELARVLLCEQTYRALTLIANHPYSR
jgi:23S rRNA (pseudouridine1915-N3)-methyltransferase